MFEKLERLQILCLGLIIALSILITAKVVTSSISQNVITVTGSASEIVKSDSGRVELRITVNNRSKQLGYKKLQEEVKVVSEYLKNKNITDIEVKTSDSYPVNKRDSRGNITDDADYYVISQTIVAKSDNVELIKEISTDATTLTNDKVDVSVNEPSYNYSKIADLKVELLEKASKDAKDRANSMLKPTRNRAGKIQNVKMGVYQITPVDSTDVTDNGINDTSSIDKKVTAVANISFKIK